MVWSLAPLGSLGRDPVLGTPVFAAGFLLSLSSQQISRDSREIKAAETQAGSLSSTGVPKASEDLLKVTWRLGLGGTGELTSGERWELRESLISGQTLRAPGQVAEEETQKVTTSSLAISIKQMKKPRPCCNSKAQHSTHSIPETLQALAFNNV